MAKLLAFLFLAAVMVAVAYGQILTTYPRTVVGSPYVARAAYPAYSAYPRAVVYG
ncbi:hypothetical protein Ocin01_10696 [Orchesella cincta]|uniref:Uncharacterized protein n=1 Tax=Orchesella cincta TaxID=48709 RepID=A0A1D2MTG2_ORCCI|nr:hypothetical protein Ocin01_10696 [Orchesella cincta]